MRCGLPGIRRVRSLETVAKTDYKRPYAGGREKGGSVLLIKKRKCTRPVGQKLKERGGKQFVASSFVTATDKPQTNTGKDKYFGGRMS